MIICALQHGLGNQLFQYATARALAERTGAPLWLDATHFDHVHNRALEIGKLRVEARFLPSALARLWTPNPGAGTLKRAVKSLAGRVVRTLRDEERGFDPRVGRAGWCTRLDGMWQSARYFAHLRPRLLAEFEPRAPLPPAVAAWVRRVADEPSVAVHVRRGDLVANPEYARSFGTLGPGYYREALARVEARVPGARVYVFSDDPAWCERHLPGVLPTEIVSGRMTRNAVEDLAAMKACRHFVVANSTFSWWGAWLGTHAEKMVIAPARFHRETRPWQVDLVPESWETLEPDYLPLPGWAPSVPVVMPAAVVILICTRNRAESLRATLAAIGECAVPPGVTAELIVVDNGSTDDTADTVRAARLPGLTVRYVPEPQPGLSRARNAGLRATLADVMIFTDDDVRPPAGWIGGMCRPILTGQADAVAGRVGFPPTHEAWLAREPFRSRRGWFAATDDFSDPPRRLVGANMALSRRVVEAVGEFDVEVGAGATGFHDESLWSLRLLAAGFRIAAAGPESTVAHHFDRTRLTRGALLSLAERMGRSNAWVDHHWYQHESPPKATKRWRARGMLWISRALTPWRGWQGAAPRWELQRVETLAYLEGLTEYAGQERKYGGR